MRKILIAVLAALPLSALAGVAGDSLNEQNTAKAWENAPVQVPTDGVQAAIQEAIQSYETGATPSLPVIAETGGTVFFPVDGTIPLLQTQVGHYSLVVFGKGAVPAAVAGAPADQWSVKTLSVAGRPALEIMPLYAGIQSNLQVAATSRHGHLLAYTVGLTSAGNHYTPVLRFYRDRPIAIPVVAVPGGVQASGEVQAPGKPVATPSGAPEAPVNATANINPDWTALCVTGDCTALMPSSVASANGQTVVRLPHAQNAPLVLTRDKAGQAGGYVPATMQGRTLVVGAVPHQIDLLSPMGTTEVRIIQEGE